MALAAMGVAGGLLDHPGHTGIGLGGLPPFRQLWHEQPFALLTLLLILGGWLAGPAMRAQASEKAGRLGLRALSSPR